MTHGKRRNVGASVRARLMNRSRETSKVKPIRAHEEDVGFRALFWANISSARIRMQIDIGFGNAIQPSLLDADYPTLLDASRPANPRLSARSCRG